MASEGFKFTDFISKLRDRYSFYLSSDFYDDRTGDSDYFLSNLVSLERRSL